MITLYGISSPNVRKVVILLEELELPWMFERVDVFGGAQFDPDFMTISPFSKVPVIADAANGGHVVFESGAILIYLAEQYGGFLPHDSAGRSEVLQWLFAQVGSIGPMLGQQNHFRMIKNDRESYAATRYHAQAERLYAVLDTRLGKRGWLAGDGYSIADIATYPWALYLERHGFSWDSHRHLRDWCGRIGERPAVIRQRDFFDEREKRDREAMTALSADALARFMWLKPQEGRTAATD